MRVPATALVFLAFGCQGGAPSTPTSTQAQRPASETTEAATTLETPGETSVVELRLDQTVSAGELHLLWLELNDSRCPVGVDCVWEGQAVVTLEVRRGGEASRKVELTLRAGVETGAKAVAGHQLRLLNVEPYPRDGVATERGEYVATLSVEIP